MSDLRVRVTKEQVYDFLSDKEWHKRKEIARTFKVTTRTISSRMTELARDGVSLINGKDGYRFVEPDDVDDEIAQDIERMARWVVGIVSRQALSAKPMKKLMTRARKLLPQDKEERLIVRKYLVQLTHLIDWDEADDD
jgi:biotin operon repressor